MFLQESVASQGHYVHANGSDVAAMFESSHSHVYVLWENTINIVGFGSPDCLLS